MRISATFRIPVPKILESITVRCPEIIFIILYAFYCLVHTWSSTEFANVVPGWGMLSRLCNYSVILGMAFAYLTYSRIRIKAGLGICVSAVLALLVAWKGDSLTESIILVLFMASGVKLKNDSIIRVFFWLTTFAVGITALFSIIGIFHMEIAKNAGRNDRYYFGFTYTTYLPNYFFHLLLVYYYLKKEIHLKDTVIVMLMNYVIYKFTDTRAVFYCVILLVALLWLSQKFPKLFSLKLFGLVSTLFMPIMAGLMFWLSNSFSIWNATFVKLNEALSGRLELGHRAIEKYGFPLFGTDVEWVTGRAGFERTKEYFYVDSSYLNGMFSFGVIIMLIVIIGFSVMNYKAYKNKNSFFCIILLLLALHSFTDPQLMSLKYNPFLLLLGKVILTKENPQLESRINASDYILQKWRKVI